MVDSTLLQLIKPKTLALLFATCQDESYIGKVCRKIGGQNVDLDHSQEILFNMAYSELTDIKKFWRDPPFMKIDEKRYGGNGYKALEKANFKCQICGETQMLKIHHNNGYSCDLNDLIVLCSKCHGMAHSNKYHGHVPLEILTK